MSAIPCPRANCFGYLARQAAATYRCDGCRREWVVSFTEARPYGEVNPDAPFHRLVLDIDAIAEEQRMSACRATMAVNGTDR